MSKTSCFFAVLCCLHRYFSESQAQVLGVMNCCIHCIVRRFPNNAFKMLLRNLLIIDTCFILPRTGAF